jgi:hypothetical protein
LKPYQSRKKKFYSGGVPKRKSEVLRRLLSAHRQSAVAEFSESLMHMHNKLSGLPEFCTTKQPKVKTWVMKYGIAALCAFESRVRSQDSRAKSQESRIKSQESRIKNQESRIKNQKSRRKTKGLECQLRRRQTSWSDFI